MIALYLATGVIAHPAVVPVGSVNTPGGYDFLGRSGKRKRKIEEDDYSEPIPLEIKKTTKATHEEAAESSLSKRQAAKYATDMLEKLASDRLKTERLTKRKLRELRARLLSEDDWFMLN